MDFGPGSRAAVRFAIVNPLDPLKDRMTSRWVFVVLGLASAGAAHAQTLPALTLPTLALDPAPQPSIWNGLYVGTEVVAVSRKGSKGLFGGGVDAGYDREFANHIVLGLRGSTGFMPGWSSRSTFKGLDYAATDVRIGYDMGRVLPFVTAGLALAKPHFGPGVGYLGTESFNTLINGSNDLHALTRVGAGVDIALTSTLTVGVAVSMVNGRGPLVP